MEVIFLTKFTNRILSICTISAIRIHRPSSTHRHRTLLTTGFERSHSWRTLWTIVSKLSRSQYSKFHETGPLAFKRARAKIKVYHSRSSNHIASIPGSNMWLCMKVDLRLQRRPSWRMRRRATLSRKDSGFICGIRIEWECLTLAKPGTISLVAPMKLVSCRRATCNRSIWLRTILVGSRVTRSRSAKLAGATENSRTWLFRDHSIRRRHRSLRMAVFRMNGITSTRASWLTASRRCQRQLGPESSIKPPIGPWWISLRRQCKIINNRNSEECPRNRSMPKSRSMTESIRMKKRRK